MKKLFFLTIFFILVGLSSFAQLTVDQSIVQTGPYKVGDTITIKYTVVKGTTTPRYFWLRYQYNNKALSYVSTTFSQGASSQTFYTAWSNYIFNANSNYDVKDLYKQYGATPWSYVSNSDWNVAQLTVQRTDAAVDGVIATQKYVVLAKSDYLNIHKLDMAYGVDNAGANITNVTTSQSTLSLGTVTGGLAAFNVRIAFPSNDATITNLKAILQPLNVDGTINYSAQSIAQTSFNAQGIASFTAPKVGDKFGVIITPTASQSYLNNIITVSDAYKSFLGVTSVGLDGTSKYFTYPTLERAIGHVTINDTVFDNNDAYYTFSYVMGIDVSSKTRLPSSTASQVGFLYGKKSAWASGILTDKTITITSATQTEDFAYAYSGDLDYSNSTDPSTIPGAVAGQSVNPSSSTIKSFGVTTFGSIAYTPASLQNVTMGLSSSIDANGKVVLNTNLSTDSLAGIEVILQYDNTKLTLDQVVFDAGNTVTNFSTHNGNRITFGSLDQMKNARIKKGTPYKLIFTPTTPLNNTAGLFFTVLSDAVDGNGKKINLTVE
jgi:hypothetical protein